ncbi:MAG: hypothetical protein V3U24_02840 [Candidatus Neomarinimicrobiota bacterium]
MRKNWFIAGFLLLTGCAVFIPMRVGPPSDIQVEITAERVELGTKLAEGILACGSCHTTGNFAGDPQLDKYLAGDVWTLEMEGTLTVPNITPDKETGIGNWTDGEIIRAITKGLNKDGRQLFPAMPWPEFDVALSMEEVCSIVAYLRTVPEPVRNVVPDNKLKLPVSMIMSTGMIYRMVTKNPMFADYEPRSDTPVERGKRLAYMGMCVDCHAYAPGMMPKYGEPLAGGFANRMTDGKFVACSNLTPDEETGIGSFTDEELYQSIKYGKRLRPLPETEMVRWPMMPRIPNHTLLTDEEINDLIAFFRSQEPIKHDIMKKAEELSQK